MRNGRHTVERALIDLSAESTKAAGRRSWKGALVLGLLLFLVVGVAMPYGIEWWSEARTQASQQTNAGRVIAPAMHQILMLRAVLPLRIIGTTAGILCLLIAMWKLTRELARK